ncbi:MAG TPA: caspase family protein, partial [Blastocatellia bacterium]|nr:caspase family protein [Blastocatellia bacterium]
LQFADADARSIQKFLQSPAGGGFPSENALVLLNEQATLARVREALTGFIMKPGPDDLLVIFFASHGGPDPFAPQNLYFLTHDSQLTRLPETALAMKDFQMMLQQNVRAQRLVLLVDTCRSAGLSGTPGELTRGLRNNLVNLYAERLLYREEGKAVITSSDVNEDSAEGPRWGGGHGVFSHFLLEGLQGKADANNDRLITVGELFRFVRQKVRLETQFRQNPRVLMNTNENLALAASGPAAPAK